MDEYNIEQVPTFNDSPEQVKETPVGVKIISVFYYIQFAAVIIVGGLILFNYFKNSVMPGYSQSFLLIAVMIILTIVMVVFVFSIAHGLWKGKSWTRSIVIIFSIWEFLVGLCLVVSLSSILSLKNILIYSVAILINGIIACYLLFNEKVNEFFKEDIPLGVQLISMWCYIGVFICALLAIACLIGISIIGLLIPSLAGGGLVFLIIAAVILILIGLLNFFVGRGLKRKKNLARIVTIIFAILGLLAGIYSLVSGFTSGTYSAVGSLISALQTYLIFGEVVVILIYGFISGYLLFSSKVKEAFNKSSAFTTQST